MTPTTSLVLSGAGAKGSFHAGAIQKLVDRGVELKRIAGTSAGAINGAVLAAGLACGRPEKAALMLSTLWVRDGSWRDTLAFSPRALWRCQGLSSMEKIQARLETALWQVMQADGMRTRAPHLGIEFRCVATDLMGLRKGPTNIGHDREFCFDGHDFATDPGRKRIARAVCASAAFPGLFAPVILDGHVLVDGGVCDNAPMSYALGRGPDLASDDVTRVIVVSSSAGRPVPKRAASRGWGLATDVVDILINDRLSRDIEATETMNRRVSKVDDALFACLSEDRKVILEAFPYRKVEITEIRPIVDLPGGVFSGLFSKRLREGYEDAGRVAAGAALRGEPVAPVGNADAPKAAKKYSEDDA